MFLSLSNSPSAIFHDLVQLLVAIHAQQLQLVVLLGSKVNVCFVVDFEPTLTHIAPTLLALEILPFCDLLPSRLPLGTRYVFIVSLSLIHTLSQK